MHQDFLAALRSVKRPSYGDITISSVEVDGDTLVLTVDGRHGETELVFPSIRQLFPYLQEMSMSDEQELKSPRMMDYMVLNLFTLAEEEYETCKPVDGRITVRL